MSEPFFSVPTGTTAPTIAFGRTPPVAASRLTTLSLLGGAIDVLPLPFLSVALLRRVRGAVAHDMAARHGLSLTEDARAAMAEPTGGPPPGVMRAGVEFLARRVLLRFGLLAALPPITTWLQIYALGLLFDRYLERFRVAPSVRIHAPEATRIRTAVDQAMRGVLTLDLDAGKAADGAPAEDLRDATTRLVDEVLLGIAAIPEHLQRRLEAAFDLALERESDGRKSASRTGHA